VALVDRLQAENRELSAAAAMWAERCRVLEERLALAPPESRADAPTSPDPPDLTPGPLAASAAVTVPWWRRWMSAVCGW
jgi:hypothetical protein